jgi:hypothetical protein
MSLLGNPYPLPLLKIESHVRFGSEADVKVLFRECPLIAMSGP